MGTRWKKVGTGIGKAARFAYAHHQARQAQKQQQGQAEETLTIEPSAKTFYDGFTAVLIQIIGLVAPLLIAMVLTVGNGYFFSGFHEWTMSDPLVVWAYIGGGVLEAIGLGLVYRAARRYRKGDYKGLMFTFAWLGILMAGSIFAQYMFLQGLYTNGVLKVPDNAAEHAPIFSALVGIGAMRGHDIVFFVRAVLFHIGELACSFVVVDKAKTASQIIAERREIHDAQIAMERQNMQLEHERNEAVQDMEIKKLQHQWLLAQVRQGVVFVDSEVSHDRTHVQEDASPLRLPQMPQVSSQEGNGSKGHTN